MQAYATLFADFLYFLYREPGSNRHAHHWAKDFKSFLSTNSNIAATRDFRKSAAKVLLFFDMTKCFGKKISKCHPFNLISCAFICRVVRPR